MPYKDIAKELIIFLGFSVMAAFTINYFSPNGIALIWPVGHITGSYFRQAKK